jgi:hypothetical protein
VNEKSKRRERGEKKIEKRRELRGKEGGQGGNRKEDEGMRREKEKGGIEEGNRIER